jgi:hypothetical protein
MNKEIKYRGFYSFEGNALYPEDKRWVYGYYYFEDGKYWIKDGNKSYCVVDGTVGQYIGKDKNNVEIYENDILYNGQNWGIIKWRQKQCCFGWFSNNEIWDIEDCNKMEVVGNSYQINK